MKLKTLENQLQRFADAKELSLEDALVILNAVYDAFSYDVGRPLSACRVEDPEALAEVLTAQLYGLLDVCASHRSEIRAIDSGDLAEAQKELETLRRETAAVAAQRKEQASLRGELLRRRGELAAQKDALAADEQELQQLKDELEALQDWLEQHPEDALTALQQKAQQMRRERDARLEQLDAAADELRALKAEIAALPERQRQAEAERDACKEDFRRRCEALDAVKAQQEALSRALHETEQERNAVNSALLTERPKLQAQQALRDELQTELDRQREALQAQEEACAALREAFSEAEQGYKDAYTRASSLELSIKNLNTGIESMRQPIADAEAEREQLEAEHTARTETLSALQAGNRKLREALDEKAALTGSEYDMLAEAAAAEAARLEALRVTLDEKLRAMLGESSDLLLVGIPEAAQKLQANERALERHREEKAAIDRQISDGESKINKLLAEISEKKQFIGEEGSIEEKRARAVALRDALLPQWERVKSCLQEAQALEAENEKRRAEIDAAEARKQKALDAEAALAHVMTPEWRGSAALLSRRLQSLAAIYQCLGVDFAALTGEQLPQYDIWQDYLKNTGATLDTLLSEIKKYAELQ